MTGDLNLGDLGVVAGRIRPVSPIESALGVLRVLNMVGQLVQANLLGNALTAQRILGAGLVAKDVVHFFQGKSLEFRQKEHGIKQAHHTETHEDEVRLVANVVEHNRGGLCYSEVNDPVCRRGNRHALRAHVEREDFGGNLPMSAFFFSYSSYVCELLTTQANGPHV